MHCFTPGGAKLLWVCHLPVTQMHFLPDRLCAVQRIPGEADCQRTHLPVHRSDEAEAFITPINLRCLLLFSIFIFSSCLTFIIRGSIILPLVLFREYIASFELGLTFHPQLMGC